MADPTLPYDSVPGQPQPAGQPLPSDDGPAPTIRPGYVRTGPRSMRPIDRDMTNATRILSKPGDYTAEQVAQAERVAGQKSALPPTPPKQPNAGSPAPRPVITQGSAPEKDAAVMEAWDNMTFDSSLLGNRLIRVGFVSGSSGGHTGGGSIAISADMPPANIPGTFLHELGHIVSKYVLTPTQKEELYRVSGHNSWGYVSDEDWANAFARAFAPPGVDVNHLPYTPVSVDMVRELLAR